MNQLGHRDRRRVQRAASLLRAVSVGGSPGGLFEAFEAIAPVGGGLIGAMGAETGSMISHVVGLPSDVLQGWATTPVTDLQRMMSPLVTAAPGELISDRMAITGAFREQLALLRVLDSAGLGESAGYKLGSGTDLVGRPQHRFLTLALEDRAVFTPSQREIFRVLHPLIDEALGRMSLPLGAQGPFFSAMLEEDRLGYLCLSDTGAIIELNERAHALAHRYAGAARVHDGRGWLARFAGRVFEEARRSRRWVFAHESGTQIEIRVYHIGKERHAVGQDLELVTISESDPLMALDHSGLTLRQRDVARLLLATGLSYKQLADRLGITEGTVRKHVENIYRHFGVHSRAELGELASRLG